MLFKEVIKINCFRYVLMDLDKIRKRGRKLLLNYVVSNS